MPHKCHVRRRTAVPFPVLRQLLVVMDKPGTIDVGCSIHPGMKTQIQVQR